MYDDLAPRPVRSGAGRRTVQFGVAVAALIAVLKLGIAVALLWPGDRSGRRIVHRPGGARRRRDPAAVHRGDECGCCLVDGSRSRTTGTRRPSGWVSTPPSRTTRSCVTRLCGRIRRGPARLRRLRTDPQQHDQRQSVPRHEVCRLLCVRRCDQGQAVLRSDLTHRVRERCVQEGCGRLGSGPSGQRVDEQPVRQRGRDRQQAFVSGRVRPCAASRSGCGCPWG
jgi:hypothetical protein